jgi:hypothetical protein
MNSKNYLVTWMYSSAKGEKIVHHQSGGDSDQLKTQNFYWRCVFCMFESSWRNNKDLFIHILYVNKLPPESIDGIPTDVLVKKFNIDIRFFPARSLPPKGFYKAWSSQFLLLDIFDEITQFIKPEDRVLILDSDCVFSKPVMPDFLNDIDTYGGLLYTIDYPPTKLTNDLSTEMIKALTTEWKGNESEGICYEGGEIVCLKGEKFAAFSKEVRNVFNWSVERHKQGLPKFNTEEHMFSAVYGVLGMRPLTGNKYIKRLWTDISSAVNLEPADEQRLIWHLPAEKKNGFVRYFRILGRNGNSLAGHEKELSSIFRIKPTFRDKLKMMAKIPLKKTYRMIKSIG